MRLWLFILGAAALAHAMLYVADREISAGVDRLSRATLARPDALDADPDLKLITEQSAFMRDER